MKYLLDVNALIAWHHPMSPSHLRFHEWAATNQPKLMATCALVELGFLRVSMQVFRYPIDQAQLALKSMKAVIGHFLSDAPSPLLPTSVTSAAQTSDAYLCQLAKAHGMKLTTFDVKIPGAYLIP